MRHFVLAFLLVGMPPMILVGQNPGQKVVPGITITSVTISADTAGVSYVLTNGAGSTEPLWRYFVDAPAGVLRITASAGSLEWYTDTSFRDRSMARWIFYPHLAAGSTTPELHFAAVGLPAIVTYWVGGHFRLPSRADEPEPDTASLPDPLVTAMVSGKTVGFEAWPTNRSSQALLARLRILTQSSCSTPLVWITDSGLCTQLLGDLDQAEAYRASSQSSLAKGSLAHYRSLLVSGNTSGSVKSSAYWLLTSNSEIVDRVM